MAAGTGRHRLPGAAIGRCSLRAAHRQRGDPDALGAGRQLLRRAAPVPIMADLTPVFPHAEFFRLLHLHRDLPGPPRHPLRPAPTR